MHISIEIHYFIQIELFSVEFLFDIASTVDEQNDFKGQIANILKSSKSVESMEEITMLSGNPHDFFSLYFVSLFAIFFFIFFLSSQENVDSFLCFSNSLSERIEQI